MLFMHNTHLNKCSISVSFFPKYNNLYKNTFHNFTLLNIKSIRYHQLLSFKGPKSWNSSCSNKLIFIKLIFNKINSCKNVFANYIIFFTIYKNIYL